MPISYYNKANADTLSIKNGDTTLDWGTNSALDWTCNVATCSTNTYVAHGKGYDPENAFGTDYWKFDVDMVGNSGDAFLFKFVTFMGTTGPTWETFSGNHAGKVGHLNVVHTYNSAPVIQTLLAQP